MPGFFLDPRDAVDRAFAGAFFALAGAILVLEDLVLAQHAGRRLAIGDAITDCSSMTIGATTIGSCVYYEVCGASTDDVEFGYRLSSSTGSYDEFEAAGAYSSSTGKWTST